jgi:fumarate hydratase subunit beta
MAVRLHLPLTDEIIAGLKSGDKVVLTGVIYVARDAAHKRLVETLEQGQPLPFDIKGQVIYYMGPTPARPGQPTGSAGPTTSSRMDSYTPRLLEEGLKGIIGKGMRSKAVKDAMIKYKAIYLAAIGGTGALIARSIKKSEPLAYEELGAEAIRRLEVVDFPATVINDIYGGDLYLQGKAAYKVESK